MNLIVHRFLLILALFTVSFASSISTPILNKDGQLGLLSVYSARSLGKSRLVIGAYGDFANDKNFVKSLIYRETDTSGYDTLNPQSTLLQIQPNLAFGITSFWDIAATLPLNFDIMAGESPEAGLGDLKLTTKLSIAGDKKTVFNAALLYGMTLPTGSEKSGLFPRYSLYYKKNSNDDSLTYSSSYYSSKGVDFDIEALFTLDENWLLLYLNSGCIFTTNKEIDNALVINAAFEIRPSNSFAFFTEFSSTCRFYNVANGLDLLNDPVWIQPGISFMSTAGTMLTLSGGINLNSKEIIFYDANHYKRYETKMAPSWRIGIQLGWSGALKSQDADNDLILDKDDECPNAAEDVDGYEDQDGCPDYDNDKDGIPDSLDKCPNAAEDKDGFEDQDGCPDFDNDKDMIADTVDKCPNVPEDKDGFEDQDGCPDYDNDRDGVPDSIDKCRNVAEDRDGFEDDDGCPDIDNDLDGIVDSLDKCPNLAGVKENDGCPGIKNKPKEIKRGNVILPGVAFEPKSTIIVQSAYVILDQLFESLSGYPEVKLEIHGHTDATGNSADNLLLTQKRADAIRDYLVGRGISKDRLITKGIGDSEPIAENNTIPGKQLNNRIEIIRIDP